MPVEEERARRHVPVAGSRSQLATVRGASWWWCEAPAVSLAVGLSLVLLTLALMSAGRARAAITAAAVVVSRGPTGGPQQPPRVPRSPPSPPLPPVPPGLCALVGNVITTKRQLRDCAFPTVVVAVNGDPTRGAFDPMSSPFPVLYCAQAGEWCQVSADRKPPQSLWSLLVGRSGGSGGGTAAACTNDLLQQLPGSGTVLDTPLDGPPCIRPGQRESPAYAAFVVQNYDHLPAHMVFVHGHETSHHQDAPLTTILREFERSGMRDSVYVSLNTKFDPDYRQTKCFMPRRLAVWGCSGQHMGMYLQALWDRYIARFAGALPRDASDLCCSQFLVSRDRVRLRQRALYVSLLQMFADSWSGRLLDLEVPQQAPWRQWTTSSSPGVAMEMLWPLIFGNLPHVHGVSGAHDAAAGIAFVDGLNEPEAVRAYRRAWSSPDE